MNNLENMTFEAIRSWAVVALHASALADEAAHAIGLTALHAADADIAGRRCAQERASEATEWQQFHGLPWQFTAEQWQRNSTAIRHFNTLVGQLGAAALRQYHDWAMSWIEHERRIVAEGAGFEPFGDAGHQLTADINAFLAGIKVNAVAPRQAIPPSTAHFGE